MIIRFVRSALSPNRIRSVSAPYQLRSISVSIEYGAGTEILRSRHGVGTELIWINYREDMESIPLYIPQSKVFRILSLEIFIIELYLTHILFDIS
ncbi:hypothetical protein HMPREF9447_03673 [Bacteroides oleiciplenus YIT 12058]|uniref:Uncharacterized protein n=1 Tax=Bacteroides oleiciplenus YIT 12058 TaxID=742727 RepID=K9DY94_9BACE|nr:hypothetical protein HMPREF9447_03673 [Bacteroides oleiciplenus YIT 12058]